jgi:hypothetical protein
MTPPSVCSSGAAAAAASRPVPSLPIGVTDDDDAGGT